MKTTKQKAIDWYNGLGKTKRDELALDYYGSTLLWDDEIEAMYIFYVPEEITFTKEDLQQSFNAGVKRGYSGYPNTDNWTQPEFEDWFNSFFAQKTKTEEK